MKFELSLLKQPVGQIIAEHVIKKNHDNYHIYYPLKANKYTEKGFAKEDTLDDSLSNQNHIDPMKLDPHILMKAVDRQLNMSDN
jgi:membrane-anchored protein YejM (alkaline phosphatase superfamily)